MVPSPGDVKDDPAGEKGPIPEWSLYFAAGVIGAVFFMMEMVWYRMLSPILGGSTFTFGLILAVALAGIGIGGAIYPVLFRNRVPTLGSFIQTLALESLCIAVPFALGDWLAILAMSLQQFSIFGFWGQAFGWIAVTIVVVLPAAILAGVQFAVLVGLIGEGNKDVGRQLGNTFAWNTLGSIIGSLAGGFGLMTLLTAPGVWRLVIVALVLVALLLFIYEYRRIAWPSALMAWLTAIVALFCLSAEGPTALWRHGGIGAGRIVEIGQTQNEHRAKQNSLQRQIIFESDGREAAVAIANTESLAFLVNGKSDGNAYSDAGTQIMLGMVGAMQHPNPKRSLVVGLGTGESAGWLASVSSMEQVDVVELEPAVLEMARLCSPINHDVLNHPKVNIIINDAREHLQTTKNQYDLIASEPSNPYRAGISSLYTREFYLSAAERLRQGGVFSQWLQAYEVDVDTIRIVFATLRSVFPYMEVWQTLEGDMVITCSMEPLTYTIKDLRIKLAEPEYAAATRVAWHTTDVSGVMSHLIASDAFIEEVVKRSPRVNTDDSNHLEFGFARTVGKALGFSLETLIGESEQEDARWPDRLKLHVDKQRVADLKSAVDAISASGVTVNKNNSSLVAVWKAVEADSHGDAVQIWDSIRGNKSFKDLDYAELCLLGISLAKTKDPRLVELLAELAKYSESNANALAIFALGIDQQDLLANQLRKVYLSAQNDPSILPIFLLNALVQGQELASVSPSHSPMIYQALRNPLALHRHNEQRINALISAGQSINANAVAGALEDWEPFPIWTQPMLELRLNAYRETNSRYVEQAENDWRLFMERAAEATLIQESDLP